METRGGYAPLAADAVMLTLLPLLLFLYAAAETSH